jgi:minichromosome maintenance protein 10
MSTSSAPKRKPAYDPTRQWGLKPVEEPSGATYIVAGHIVNGSKWDSVHSTENIGREGQAKAKRKLSVKDADRALVNLSKRDKEGMRAVMKARQVGGCDVKKEKKPGTKKEKGAAQKANEPSVGSDEEESPAEEEPDPTKAGYSAEVIKQLGFDPTMKGSHNKGKGNLDMQKKV